MPADAEFGRLAAEYRDAHAAMVGASGRGAETWRVIGLRRQITAVLDRSGRESMSAVVGGDRVTAAFHKRDGGGWWLDIRVVAVEGLRGRGYAVETRP